MGKYVIETKNLTKQYGTQKSVANLNIHVQKGRIYGLLGRNGAGKTTTMKNNVTMIFPMCIAFSVFGVCKCGIHGNGRLDDGISGNFCNISIADICTDDS